MKTRILAALKALEAREGMEILFACESGSRAWGFASPDSDYDVRFVYRRPVGHYLRLGKRSDTLTEPIVDELDFAGWDLDKTLTLLRASNPSLLEWLRSPILYRADEAWLEDTRQLMAQCWQPRALYYHYLSMAKANARVNGRGGLSVKGALYVLRPLLCARWLLRFDSLPPLDFTVLYQGLGLGAAVKGQLESLLAFKRQALEQDELVLSAELSAFIESELGVLEGSKPALREKAPMVTFDAFFMKSLALNQ
ncbi:MULTISPECIES: DNA polymerase beta superfamily protein [Gammaproteobacteria]|uniref:nucleotidyltransferase domain-containing protein n=1 Tax=Gammaproteobacteria TaxID=1236 RepID=UPI003A90F586